MDREVIIRKIRIENLINAFYLCESGKEIYQALSKIPYENIKEIRDMCSSIIENSEGEIV